MPTGYKQNGTDLELIYYPRSDTFNTPPYTEPGQLWAWGDNTYGQLGLGNNINVVSLVQVGIESNWYKIRNQAAITLATKTDGTLWAWGYNGDGNLGLGDTTHRSSPVQVGSLTDWVNIQSSYASFGLKSNGTLWTWGLNNNGQLGLGDTTNRSSPVQVGALTDWADIKVYGHSIALKTDGTLWAWGDNTNGRLGLGDITNRSSPVQVGSLTDWSLVGSVFASTSAVKTDGTLWAWGDNTYGQLGLGDITPRSSPVQVGALTNWSKVYCARNYQALAIKTDGTLWAWGRNQFYSLGLGDETSRSSPVQVGSDTDWSHAVVSDWCFFVFKTDGTLYYCLDTSASSSTRNIYNPNNPTPLWNYTLKKNDFGINQQVKDLAYADYYLLLITN